MLSEGSLQRLKYLNFLRKRFQLLVWEFGSSGPGSACPAQRPVCPWGGQWGLWGASPRPSPARLPAAPRGRLQGRPEDANCSLNAMRNHTYTYDLFRIQSLLGRTDVANKEKDRKSRCFTCSLILLSISG